MIVFVVESGEYSDYKINAIFESEQMAKDFVAAAGGDGYRSWELNMWRPDQGKWTFDFSPQDGSITKEKRHSSLDEPTNEVYTLSRNIGAPIEISVKTGDRERAVKIASERFSRIMSQMENALALLDKASDWYTPYPDGPCFDRQGVAVEIAEILSGIAPLPKGQVWKDDSGKERFGYSTHQEHIYRILGVPFAREPQ